MKKPNRDLLVLVKDEKLNEAAMEFELEQLNRILLALETVECLCIVHEVFDLNKYRILSAEKQIKEVLQKKELKAFVFISNKN